MERLTRLQLLSLTVILSLYRVITFKGNTNVRLISKDFGFNITQRGYLLNLCYYYSNSNKVNLTSKGNLSFIVSNGI